MRTGPPSRAASARLLAARTLASLSAGRHDPDDLDGPMTRRVESLREQIASGTYRIDPERLAVAVYDAIRAGGL